MGIQATPCYLGPNALLQDAQHFSSQVGHSPSKKTCHVATMKGVDERNGKILTQTFSNLIRLAEIDEIITLGL
jgi:hypothetical protein